MTLKGQPNVTILKTARAHEVLTYTYLSNLFGNRKMTIGDASVDNIGTEPDIYSSEILTDSKGKKYREIGAEVVICEPSGYFRLPHLEFPMAVQFYKIQNNELDLQINQNVSAKLKSSSKCRLSYKFSDLTGFYTSFETDLVEKLTKLSGGSYSCCKNISLFIVSYGVKSTNINLKILKQKYENIIKKSEYSKLFNNVIIIFDDCAYNLAKNCCFDYKKESKNFFNPENYPCY